MASLIWAGERKGRSLASAPTGPVRVTIGVRTDSISYEFACGLAQHSRESPTAFKLDPEVKEERAWTDSDSGRPVTLLERTSGGTWIRDNTGKRMPYSG